MSHHDTHNAAQQAQADYAAGGQQPGANHGRADLRDLRAILDLITVQLGDLRPEQHELLDEMRWRLEEFQVQARERLVQVGGYNADIEQMQVEARGLIDQIALSKQGAHLEATGALPDGVSEVM
ncbi:MAG: hypothetical protein AAGG72_09240, partial [Pseudomonadota bacterium]